MRARLVGSREMERRAVPQRKRQLQELEQLVLHGNRQHLGRNCGRQERFGRPLHVSIISRGRNMSFCSSSKDHHRCSRNASLQWEQRHEFPQLQVTSWCNAVHCSLGNEVRKLLISKVTMNSVLILQCQTEK